MQEDVSYASIEPLVSESNQDDDTMHCVFQCPVTGKRVSAEGDIEESSSAGAIAKRSALQTALYTIRYGISWVLYQLFGYNMGGMMATDFAREATSEATHKVEDRAGSTKAERQQAIVRAFTSVKAQFQWDDERGQWVARSGEEQDSDDMD